MQSVRESVSFTVKWTGSRAGTIHLHLALGLRMRWALLHALNAFKTCKVLFHLYLTRTCKFINLLQSPRQVSIYTNAHIFTNCDYNIHFNAHFHGSCCTMTWCIKPKAGTNIKAGNTWNKLHTTTYRAQMRVTARIKFISLFRDRGHGVRMTCTAIKFTDRRLNR